MQNIVIIADKDWIGVSDMDVLEKILEEIDKLKENCLLSEFENGYTAGALDMANAIKDVICANMGDGKDTNVPSNDDMEDKIREHIAECLHRIDNIRSFIGSKEYTNNDEKCIRNIEVLNTIITALEGYLSSKKKSGNDGWIPVDERLPEVQEGLEDMYCPEFNVTIKGAEITTTLKYSWDGTWFDDYGTVYNVIAWQPLPERYKGGDDRA